MTTDNQNEPLSVYRLLPGLGEFRTLSLEEYAHRKLIRWLRTGSPADLPEELRAEWVGDPRLRPTDFPCGYPGAPVFGRRIVDLLRDELHAAGRCLPVVPEGAVKKDPPDYLLYAVDKVVDCVDVRRSSKPKKGTGQMKVTVFRPDAVPAGLPAFRVPEYPGAVHWNGWMVERLRGLLGDDLEARLVWSEDRSRTPHPDPWGF
ncbi:hypothetical protein [Streptomyces apricus]|uniref:Uncharacterized protein n=1 Tax=Streptomyces apricus TaxID=1828112 RepID=A0A5B0BJQ2_9ACTN|nr:hypothetical protein [Streptomyces apricus]KAA0941886.1 hypothetical protein FGF04_04405 [Streptomyces apricus]